MTSNSKALHSQTIASNTFKDENYLSIAFAIDQNYLKPCGVCIHSILIHNPHLNFKFYIFTDHFNLLGFDTIIKLHKNVCIDVYQLNTSIFSQLQSNSRFNTAIYYRLAIPEILQNIESEILYLDADIVCNGALDDLLNIQLNDSIIAAVADKGFTALEKSNLGLKSDSQYFNSGVMLINTQNWIKFKVFEQFQSVITSRKFNFPDQDALNIILENKVFFMPAKFNDMHQNIDNATFIHFVSSPKPWTIAAELNEKYMYYYKLSPWANSPLDLPRNYRDTKKLSKKYYIEKKFYLALKWFFIYLYRRLRK